MSKTEENLKTAFIGESQANRRYIIFAKKAEEEGHPEIAEVFRSIAEDETEHATEEAELMGMIKSTKENLKKTIEGENYEFTKMYPTFAKVAKEEGNIAVAERFEEIAQDEKKHAEKFKKTLESLVK